VEVLHQEETIEPLVLAAPEEVHQPAAQPEHAQQEDAAQEGAEADDAPVGVSQEPSLTPLVADDVVENLIQELLRGEADDRE
jgi:hypothetical protein